MEIEIFERMAQIEQKHWWFVGRRAILTKILKQLRSKKKYCSVLEAGAGSGGNIAMLSQFGSYHGFETAPIARSIASSNGLYIHSGSLPNDIPFPTKYFDLICVLDVLEHVEHDDLALKKLAQKLTKDGKIVVTVPAYPWLWSRHDDTHHHFRRYTNERLVTIAERAGLEIERVFRFNFFLLPMVIIIRSLKKLMGLKFDDDELPNKALNAILATIFSFEKNLVG